MRGAFLQYVCEHVPVTKIEIGINTITSEFSKYIILNI